MNSLTPLPEDPKLAQLEEMLVVMPYKAPEKRRKRKVKKVKGSKGITLVALVITILFSYDEKIKCSNSKGFLLTTI